MRLNRLIFLLLIFVAGANAQIALVSTGSDWRYLADGTDPGAAWFDPAFDDSSWSNGVAKLGFGGTGEATVIGDGTNEYTAFYFRKIFNVPDITLFQNLRMRMIVDDGAVVYLNGVEVLRHNLPAGNVDFQTLALADVAGAAETNFVTNAIISALLVNGANIVAVEVHQSATNSPDLGWEFDLMGVPSVPPDITQGPTNQMVLAGQSATFTVVATGGALSYQWQKDGVLIAGATNSTLTLSNVSPADGGGYSCVVSSDGISVTSQVATLTVNATATCTGIFFTQQPTNITATACTEACFSVTATGTNCLGTNAPVSYQWQRDDGNGFADIPGANSAIYCNPATPFDNGVMFRVVVSVPGATAASQNATLTVVPDLTPPMLVSASVDCTNNTVTLNFNELMNPEPVQNLASYSIPGVVISMAKLNADGTSVTLSTDLLLPNTAYTLTVNGLFDLCGANLIAPNPSLISLQCTAAPTIIIPPAAQTVAPGESATFTVQASGPPPLRYAWFKDSLFIAGATNATLTISNAQISDVGRYSVRVSSTNGAVTSLAADLGVLDSYSLDLPAGYSFIANQLHQSNSLISTVIPVVPDGTSLLKWDPVTQSFTSPDNYVEGLGWLSGIATLSPGEGAIINLPSPQTLLFTGAFRPPPLPPINLSGGYHLLSRQIPRPANFEQITGQSPSEGTIVDQYRPATGDYRTHVYLDGQWRDRSPLAQVGESVWVSQIALPVITAQPAPQTSATPGSTVSFAVEVSGTPPILFQWQRNGVSIPDATNASYFITNAQIFDSGIYTVAVQPSRFVPPPAQPGGQEDLPGALTSVPAALQFVSTAFPFSDDFDARQIAAAGSATLTGNNSAATVEPGEPRHADKPGGRSVWMTWMAPAHGIATFTTHGSSFDTVLAAYAGTGFPGAEVASDDDGAPFLGSRITFNATAGQMYNIAVDGFGGAAGNFVLSWNLEETTERLPTILTQPQTQVASLNATTQFRVDATGANLTYQWFMDGQAISGGTSNTLIINPVRESDVGAYTVRITSNSRFVFSHPVQLQIGAAGADEPRAVDKFPEIVFATTNTFEVVPVGPSARKAVARGFSGTQIFSSIGSTKEPGEPNHCGVRGGKSEWFSYQPTNHGILKVDTDGSNFDTVLAVYVGPGDSFLTLTNVACDNNSGTNGKTSAVFFNVTSNTIYYIAVDGVNNSVTGVAASGRVQLNYRLALPLVLTSISHSPSNDNGRIVFKITGTPNLAATVQSATNLSAPAWTSIFTNSAANGSFNYTNTNAVTFSNRFFRAVNQF